MNSNYGNAEWEKIVGEVRDEVVKHFPRIRNSLDFGAYIAPQDYFVSYIFKTDRELDAAAESGLLDKVIEYHKELMEKKGYPAEAIKDCVFASQEACDRECKGNWWYYYK